MKIAARDREGAAGCSFIIFFFLHTHIKKDGEMRLEKEKYIYI